MNRMVLTSFVLTRALSEGGILKCHCGLSTVFVSLGSWK